MALTPNPRVKLSRLRDIGWNLWDPIGLLSSEENWDDEECLPFADEYDSYLILAAGEIRRNAARDEVIDYLVEIETKHMGLNERPDTRSRAEQVVNAISNDNEIWTWPNAKGQFR